MAKLLATTLAVLLLAPASALGQGNPFGPIAPPQPAPPPIQEPEPPAPPQVDDQELSLVESLFLAGIAAALIGGVFILITRESGRFGRARRRERRGGPRGPKLDDRKRGAGAFRATGGHSAGSRGAGAPPPPPRKRQKPAKQKAKRK
ncbi:MAG TPA: hypothetical protein VNT32_13125 [Thermoleophilaceae bacterium]|nr:hypothetical protein [Thermoleophilaceae bacterium]